MNQLDAYYRGLLNYRELTTQNRECNSFRKLVSAANTDEDKIIITRTICTIEEDWICEIEKGLDFIEKAIKEERQFIYSNGEVLPIEKVKHVSTESVRHLAKHSNLIGKQETEDFVPSQLYTVERLNDYAVYENRFLYMLLCYLRDFVTLRYNKILDLTNKYDGVLHLQKEVIVAKQKITYSVDLHDERMDDKYLREHNSSKATIDRIDIILKTIISFLGTPLMECAAKTPKIKPPITKTNVLKMDNNFKGAVALYDYIIAYSKPGYTAEEQRTELAPFRDDIADELSEACAMLTFLMYEHGLGIKPMLNNSYDQEEQRRKAEAIKKRNEKLEALRRRMQTSGESPEEYILALEKQLKVLENENSHIESLHKEIFSLQEQNTELETSIKDMNTNIEKLIKSQEEAEILHIQEMEVIRADCNKRIHETIERHEQELHELEKSCNERIEFADEQMRVAKEKCKEEIYAIKSELVESRNAYDELYRAHEELAEEKNLCEAKLKAVRAQNGLMTEADDFTEQESFTQLEKEYEAFRRFYNSQWNQTKKKIRKKFLSRENLKGQNGQDEQS